MDRLNSKNTCQGNLLKGIDSCLGVAYKAVKTPLEAKFSKNSLFQLYKKYWPHIVSIMNFLGGKNMKKNELRTILFP